MTDVNDNFLAHFGVRGMKWGFRKAGTNYSVALGKKVIAKAKDSHAKTAAKRAPEHKDLRKTKKNPAKNISNADLQKAITRMNLEKQYNSLNPKGLSKGQKQIAAVLAVGASVNAAIAFAKSPAGKLIVDGIKKAATGSGATIVTETVKILA